MSNLVDRVVNIAIDRLIKHLLEDGIPSIYHYIHDDYSANLVQDSNYKQHSGGDYGEY
jgi:hypothetical protein